MRSRFPSFFRTYVSDAAFIPLFVKTLQKFNWTRVCIITEELNLFIEVHSISDITVHMHVSHTVQLQNQSPLMTALQEANITVSAQSFTFPSDAEFTDIRSRIRNLVH